MTSPDLVSYFIALLSPKTFELETVMPALTEHFGSVSHIGTAHDFNVTTYYEEEMGADLVRRIVGFARDRSPEDLVTAKLYCVAVERVHSVSGNRSINLDVGYLDHSKIVLASTKGAGQKIYLHSGIYADLVARYGQKEYRPFDWSFPDFKDNRYSTDLLTLRALHLKRCATHKAAG